MRESARIRILDRVDVDHESGCWEWSLKIRTNGYARMTFKQKSWYAHRLSYVAFVGDIPDGLEICHKCDNRKCVNPDHLFAGTSQENSQDAVNKGRQAKGFSLPQTKLSDNDRVEIMLLVNSGYLYKDIAIKFNVCRQSIGLVAMKNGVRRYEERCK